MTERGVDAMKAWMEDRTGFFLSFFLPCFMSMCNALGYNNRTGFI